MSLWTPPQCSGPCKRVGVSLDNATADAKRAWRTQQRCPLCATLKEMGGPALGLRTNSVAALEGCNDGEEVEDKIVYYRNRPETRERRALCALKASNPSLYGVIMEHKNLARRLLGGRKFSLKGCRMETGATEYDDTKDVEAEAEGSGDGEEEAPPPPLEDDELPAPEEVAPEVDLLDAEESQSDDEAPAADVGGAVDGIVADILRAAAGAAAGAGAGAGANGSSSGVSSSSSSSSSASASRRRRLCVACGTAESVGNEKLCGGCRHFILSHIQ